MEKPHDRLRLIREKRGYKSARDAARAYGWPIDAYASHENGNRNIPPDAAIRYSNAFIFSLDWLYKGTIAEKSGGVRNSPHVAFKVIPRLPWDFMKNYGGVNQAMEQAVDFASLPKNLNIVMPAFSMTIDGDSMQNDNDPGPSFAEGDEIVLSTSAKIRPGDFVIAEILDENVIVFRQYRERGKRTDGFVIYELAALNSAHRSYIVDDPNKARLVAKMTHVIKSYR
jgi:hypothetical protein